MPLKLYLRLLVDKKNKIKTSIDWKLKFGKARVSWDMRKTRGRKEKKENIDRVEDGMDREPRRRKEKRIIMSSGLLSATSVAATMETSLKKKCPRSHRGIRLLHWVNRHQCCQAMEGLRCSGRKEKQRKWVRRGKTKKWPEDLKTDIRDDLRVCVGGNECLSVVCNYLNLLCAAAQHPHHRPAPPTHSFFPSFQ